MWKLKEEHSLASLSIQWIQWSLQRKTVWNPEISEAEKCPRTLSALTHEDQISWAANTTGSLSQTIY